MVDFCFPQMTQVSADAFCVDQRNPRELFIFSEKFLPVLCKRFKIILSLIRI